MAETTKVESMEAKFDAAIAGGRVNGAVICATDTKGNFTYNKALGHRTLQSGEAVPQQLDDILFLASGTKIITTISALQCVDQGILTLDGDVSEFAPELTSQNVMKGFAEDGETPIMEPNSGPITLRMLLSHSFGQSYHFFNPDLMKWQAKNNPAIPGQRRPVEEAFDFPLTFQPGKGWMYGPGLDWAGRIVERATGMTLTQHMEKNIFAPLGISDTGFYPVSQEHIRQRMVDLNPEDPDGLGLAVLAGSGEMNQRSQGDFGGHGLFMTGPDYIKILHSLLANDEKLLKTATVEEMFKHQLGPEATTSLRDAHLSPPGTFFRVGLDESTKAGYGLGGLVTLQDLDGWYGENTLTWGGGMTLAWFIDRKNDLCGVGAVQAKIPTDTAAVSELKQVFRQGIYRERESEKLRS